MSKTKPAPKPTVKLSKTQQEVVDLIKSGWELGQGGSSSNYRVWLQFGGVGRGGESKTISKATLRMLLKKEIVVFHERNYPLDTYKLTPAGRRR